MAKTRSKPTTIVAYNGIDGALAAATALLKHPAAEIRITSARAVGQTLGELAKQRAGEIHVCGLGAHGDWSEVVENAEKVRKKGGKIIWHCGRGYLDPERYAEVCTPAFVKASSNTEAVCRHFGLAKNPTARQLVKLAKYDTNIALPQREPPAADRRWIHLIKASIGEYLKYNDYDRYTRTIQKLANQQFDEADERLVRVFEQSGFQYVLKGKSEALKKLRKRIMKCGESDEAVLITGESGVGKELVAHLVHERTRRATERFVVINCAVFAGNPELTNSALFGHVKGAFTGALEKRAGAFREASGGVLFLDELGEMPLEVQAKLLRVLEDGVVTSVGTDKPDGEKVDVMVIAATNRDLMTMVAQGTFREDLYHRLSTLQIRIPPLREHSQDIELYAVDKIKSMGSNRKLTHQELAQLRNYDWSGNVRQLKKVIHRCVRLDMTITEAFEEDQPVGISSRIIAEDRILLPTSIEDVQSFIDVRRAYARRVLTLCEGNRSVAARAIKTTTKTLRGWIK